jgi:FkbM family methyltransferase
MEGIPDKELVLKRIEGHRMYIDRSDPGISRTLRRFKWLRKWYREPEFMDIVNKEVSTDMVAFDLGANIGYVTLLMARNVGSAGRVYAVEPSPRNFEILKKNIEINNYTNRVDIYQMAISSSNGEAQFNLSGASNLHSFVRSVHSEHEINVRTVTLDEFFKDKLVPNFIKMDIEGAEVEALEGMLEILKRRQDVMKILIEVHQMYYSETRDFGRQLERLFGAGFVPKYVVSTGSKYPRFFKDRGYNPVKIYKSGEWTRGLYVNVKQEDVIEAMGSGHGEEFPLPFRSLLKRPGRLWNRVVSTPRIVRAIMLERI